MNNRIKLTKLNQIQIEKCQGTSRRKESHHVVHDVSRRAVVLGKHLLASGIKITAQQVLRWTWCFYAFFLAFSDHCLKQLLNSKLSSSKTTEEAEHLDLAQKLADRLQVLDALGLFLLLKKLVDK